MNIIQTVICIYIPVVVAGIFVERFERLLPVDRTPFFQTVWKHTQHTYMY